MIKKIVLFLLFLTIAFNVTYWAMAKYDVESDYSANGDAKYYMLMGGGQFENIPYRYSIRVLMPSMVHEVYKRLKLEAFLDRYYEDVGKKMVQLSYGLVNILFLTMSGFVFFFYCKNLKFSDWESLVGSLLFYTSFFVITYYSTPLIDSAASFFILASFYALQRKRLLWLFLIFLLGVMTKETIFVVFLIIFFDDRREILKRILVCLPGVILYMFMIERGDHGHGLNIIDIVTDFSLLKNSVLSGIRSWDLYSLIETTQTFMFLWVLWIYGLFKCDVPPFLRKKNWLLVLPFVVPFLVNSSSVGRVGFYLFPVVIPISLLVLRDVFDNGLKEN